MITVTYRPRNEKGTFSTETVECHNVVDGALHFGRIISGILARNEKPYVRLDEHHGICIGTERDKFFTHIITASDDNIALYRMANTYIAQREFNKTPEHHFLRMTIATLGHIENVIRKVDIQMICNASLHQLSIAVQRSICGDTLCKALAEQGVTA